MLLSLRNFAKTLYMADRAAQASLTSPVLVSVWERATDATRQTWVGYANAYLHSGTVPTLGSTAGRLAAFRAIAHAVAPAIGTSSVKAAGHAYAIAITPAPTASVAHTSGTQQFTAVVTDFNGDVLSLPVTWHSSVEAKATIDADGLLTGHVAGTTHVTATIVDSVAGTITSNDVTVTVT